MRKSLILYSLLLPLLLASSLRIAAASGDAGATTPWNNPVAIASENIDEDNGVSVDNLITIAPLFDAVSSHVIPIMKCAHGNWHSPDRYPPPPLVTLKRTLRI